MHCFVLTQKCLLCLYGCRKILVRNAALDWNGLKRSPFVEELASSKASDLHVCFESISYASLPRMPFKSATGVGRAQI